MIQIYCGEGKGKTTAAVGLSVRAAGRGHRVVFAQFLKGADSGERRVLETLPTVTLLELPDAVKFTFAMDAEERAQAQAEQGERFRRAVALGREADLLVLDELCAALNADMVPLEEVLAFLDKRPQDLEVVITGRNPPPALVERADYITEMRKIRHPYEQGVGARKGIEF